MWKVKACYNLLKIKAREKWANINSNQFLKRLWKHFLIVIIFVLRIGILNLKILFLINNLIRSLLILDFLLVFLFIKRLNYFVERHLIWLQKFFKKSNIVAPQLIFEPLVYYCTQCFVVDSHLKEWMIKTYKKRWKNVSIKCLILSLNIANNY